MLVMIHTGLKSGLNSIFDLEKTGF